MEFKNRITELLKEKGMTQADVCKITGISSALISNYATGKASPSLDKAIAIADALNVTLDELVGRLVKVELDETEQEIISKFRALNDSEKAEVGNYLDYIYTKHTKKILQKKSLDEAG